MGKSSKASLPADTAQDKMVKQTGPGLTNTNPILQLTLPGSMPGFGGQIPMGGNFAQQMAGLPPGLLEQIRALQAGPVQKTLPTSVPSTLPAYGLRRG